MFWGLVPDDKAYIVLVCAAVNLVVGVGAWYSAFKYARTTSDRDTGRTALAGSVFLLIAFLILMEAWNYYVK